MFVFPARRFLGVLVANKPVYTPLPAAVVVLKAAAAVAVALVQNKGLKSPSQVRLIRCNNNNNNNNNDT